MGTKINCELNSQTEKRYKAYHFMKSFRKVVWRRNYVKQLHWILLFSLFCFTLNNGFSFYRFPNYVILNWIGFYPIQYSLSTNSNSISTDLIIKSAKSIIIFLLQNFNIKFCLNITQNINQLIIDGFNQN